MMISQESRVLNQIGLAYLTFVMKSSVNASLHAAILAAPLRHVGPGKTSCKNTSPPLAMRPGKLLKRFHLFC